MNYREYLEELKSQYEDKDKVLARFDEVFSLISSLIEESNKDPNPDFYKGVASILFKTDLPSDEMRKLAKHWIFTTLYPWKYQEFHKSN